MIFMRHEQKDSLSLALVCDTCRLPITDISQATLVWPLPTNGAAVRILHTDCSPFGKSGFGFSPAKGVLTDLMGSVGMGVEREVPIVGEVR